MIASIIYIAFKGYVDNHTLSLFLVDHEEDPFRHLFFGIEYINIVYKFDSKWIRRIQEKVLKYIEQVYSQILPETI